MAARIAMMAITTSSSIRVNPPACGERRSRFEANFVGAVITGASGWCAEAGNNSMIQFPALGLGAPAEAYF